MQAHAHPFSSVVGVRAALGRVVHVTVWLLRWGGGGGQAITLGSRLGILRFVLVHPLQYNIVLLPHFVLYRIDIPS